jgi:polysaccharide biosynthesis transport protein
MKLIEFIRLIRRHIILLSVIPVFLGLLVYSMTSRPQYKYTSQTVLFTGLATGTTVEMDKSFNYYATNTSFDNLLNIINSRQVQQEVAIRLLSQHLLLKNPDSKFISQIPFDELRKIVPKEIYSLLVFHSDAPLTVKARPVFPAEDSLQVNDTILTKKYSSLLPPGISPAAYEQTVKNLTDLMNSSDTNFVYRLLNFNHPHYSIKSISSVKGQRIANSDLIKLTYSASDPGICQQTLAIFNDECIENYKEMKENRSDEVVRYFEDQLKEAAKRLKRSEDKLVAFNKANNIINYGEQSRAVAIAREELESDYSKMRAQLSGNEAAIKKLEEKLSIQQLVQLKSSQLIEKKTKLGDINYEIAAAESDTQHLQQNKQSISQLRKKAEQLKSELKSSVDDMYNYQHSTEGLPVGKVLTDWMNNVVEAETLRAKLKVMDDRNNDINHKYTAFAPAGAQLKRIEREIAVAEQGYMEFLEGLSQAKLKMQDNVLASNIKAVDPPFYPLSPIPDKRKIMVIAAALFGGLLVLGVIVLMEFFDNTLRNAKKTTAATGIPTIGLLPKVYLRPGIDQFPSVQKRLLQLTTQKIDQLLTAGVHNHRPVTITFISTQDKEGKSVIAGNLARTLMEQGKKVFFLNLSGSTAPIKPANKYPLFQKLFGYQDPRIDTQNAFLQNPETYLHTDDYMNGTGNAAFQHAADIETICKNVFTKETAIPDYLFIELPALLKDNYSAPLIAGADLVILTCRSNRVWSEADKQVVQDILPLTGTKIHAILNGVEVQETESLIGDLPKKRSWIRKKIKSLIRFQFFSKNHF